MDKQKKTLKRIVIGILIALLLATAVFAAAQWVISKYKKVTYTSGHKVDIDLVWEAESAELIPDETVTVTPSVTNTSKTDSAYVFIKLDYSDEAFAPSGTVDGWTLIDATTHVYGYGTSSALTAVAKGETVTFSGQFVVQDAFPDLSGDDLAIAVNAYAISNLVAHEDPATGWSDCQNGGDTSLLQ